MATSPYDTTKPQQYTPQYATGQSSTQQNQYPTVNYQQTANTQQTSYQPQYATQQYQPQQQNQPTAWGNTNFQPTMEQAFQNYGSAYMQPQASGQVFNYASGQLQGQGYGQDFYQQNQGALQGPSNSQQVLNGGGFSGPSAIGNLASSNPYGGQMQSSALGSMAQGYLGGPLATGDANQFAQQQARTPTELSQMGGRIDQGYMGANNSQQFQQQNASTLQGPGQLESFAASSLTGDNPYANMLRQEGMDAINQQLAARGAYGAGGGLAALAKYGANFDANLFSQQADLQGRAQDATMNRLGLGGSLAGQASQERMNQYGALQSLGNDQFSQRMGAGQLSIAGGAAADSANVARMAGITNAMGTADQMELGRLSGMTNLAGMASQNELGRLQAQIQAAGNADATGVARFNSMLNAAGQADTSQLARLNTLGNLGGQADATNLNYLNSYFNQANATQQAAGQRANDMLANEFRPAALEAGLYGGFYGQGGQQSGSAFGDYINALVNSSQVKAQGEGQWTNLVTGIIGALG